MADYDSRLDTYEHIQQVQILINTAQDLGLFTTGADPEHKHKRRAKFGDS